MISTTNHCLASCSACWPHLFPASDLIVFTGGGDADHAQEAAALTWVWADLGLSTEQELKSCCSFCTDDPQQ